MNEIDSLPTLKDRYDQMMKQSLLEDIAFDIDQLCDFRALYQKNVFGPMGRSFDSIIKTIKEHLKGVKDEYEERYRKRPDVKDAWGVYRGNRADVSGPRGPAGDRDIVITSAEYEALGI